MFTSAIKLMHTSAFLIEFQDDNVDTSFYLLPFTKLEAEIAIKMLNVESLFYIIFLISGQRNMRRMGFF